MINFTYKPKTISMDTAVSILDRMQIRIQQAVEQALLAVDLRQGNVKVERVSGGFRVTAKSIASQETFEDEAQDFFQTKDFDEISPVQSQLTLTAISESIISLSLPRMIEEAIEGMKRGRRDA